MDMMMKYDGPKLLDQVHDTKDVVKIEMKTTFKENDAGPETPNVPSA
jgi:hypothetical protein